MITRSGTRYRLDTENSGSVARKELPPARDIDSTENEIISEIEVLEISNMDQQKVMN